MSILLPDGSQYTTSPQNKKSAPPVTGEGFGRWAGRQPLEYLTLPGGGVVGLDLSRLTINDFRLMRDHYQVNASLSVLSFMQHQSDWTIECEDKKIGEFIEEQIRNHWTALNRGMSTANWAGHSPMVLQWENEGSRIVLDKVKDLIPEETVINWKEVDGWSPPGILPPKFKVYDGIKQLGTSWPIPVENSFWYPLLMEHGDYDGRKLLRAAFSSYFFSILLHLFSNRYFERFGEPVPVGRAPYDDQIELDGKKVPAAEYMKGVLQDLRNRSVVVLPNDRTVNDNGSGSNYDYDMQYLESQMRGADFERYMTRLDEEISIGMFTPILLLRTADVGSYNLGQGHMQVYQWMLNAMNDDRKVYLDKYIISKMTDYNFGPNAPRPKIKFRKMGNNDAASVKEIVTELIRSGKAKVDLLELGQIAGLTITEIRQTLKEPEAEEDPAADPATPEEDPAPAQDCVSLQRRASLPAPVADVVKEIADRVRPQVVNAFNEGTFGKGLKISMGYKRRMGAAFDALGIPHADARSTDLYNSMDKWIAQIVEFGPDDIGQADVFMNIFTSKINTVLGNVDGMPLEA